MERRDFIALLGVAAAMMPSDAGAQIQRADLSGPANAGRPADRLAGTWSYTSSINTRSDGSTFERWGDHPKGVLMFDRGHFAQIIVGGESRVFGAKVFCAFGTYTLDEVAKVLITKVQACSVSSLTGTSQSRPVLLLSANEFKYSNPRTASGTKAEVLWKRLT